MSQLINLLTDEGSNDAIEALGDDGCPNLTAVETGRPEGQQVGEQWKVIIHHLQERTIQENWRVCQLLSLMVSKGANLHVEDMSREFGWQEIGSSGFMLEISGVS